MLLLDPGEKKKPKKKSENKIPLLQYGVDPLPRLPMVGGGQGGTSSDRHEQTVLDVIKGPALNQTVHVARLILDSVNMQFS